MKQLYRVLKTLLWCVIGVFLGASIYRCWDFHTRPNLYALISAPWYTDILLSGACTAVLVVILLILMYFIRRNSDF